MAENISLRNAFEDYAMVKKEKRNVLKSLLFGTVWLSFLTKENGDKENTGRSLRLSTETHDEREAREEQEQRMGGRSRNNPTWIRNAVFCSKKIQELEKVNQGPAPLMKEAFPSPTLEDSAKMASLLLEVAIANGLEKETSAAFKTWLSEWCFIKSKILIKNLNCMSDFLSVLSFVRYHFKQCEIIISC